MTERINTTFKFNILSKRSIMKEKIIIALRRKYHCDHARLILKQSALSYPVYELDENTDSLDVLHRAIAQGAEILITGDVYAESIMNQVDISVVTIRRNRISFTDSIRNALKLSDHAAIVWRESNSPAVRKACEDFPGAVSYFPYQSTSEFPGIFQKLEEDGYKVVIGGGIINEFAKSHHMAIINVPYDESDILSAVHLAQHNLKAIEERQEQTEILHTIQDHISEGILSLEPNGKIQTANRSASTFLRMNSLQLCSLFVFQTPLNCPEIQMLLTDFEDFSGKMVTLHGSPYVLEGKAIFVHEVFRSAVLTLTPVEKLQTVEQQVRKQMLPGNAGASITFRNIIGNSPAVTSCIQTAARYAAVDSSILVYGESGTGKEMFVQSIHNASQRKKGPFVVINCAALPENLIESELFGYEKGAFTGALSGGKQGLFVQAHKGTVFLDEVSEMPLHVQARFLRVLQEHEVTPIGGVRVIPVDIRVIAATNKDLKEMVKKKLFREDLYYRISVLEMKLPSLKEREDDIELLTRHFVKQKSKELHIPVSRIDPEAIKYLRSFPYPGNIRQLSNLVERAMVLSSGNSLDLNAAVRAVSVSQGFQAKEPRTDSTNALIKAGINSLHEGIIKDTLIQNNNNRKKTAESLGISTSTLYRTMKKLGMIKERHHS